MAKRGRRDPETVDLHETFCPVVATMDLLGQKWTLHALRALADGKKRFNELAHALGGVNSRTLRKRLAALEAEGILLRRVLSDIPPWVEYELTEKGRTLTSVIDAVDRWGRRWMKPPRSRPRSQRASAASV
jgi:DNA-binding HxlR family transcriptional regulator